MLDNQLTLDVSPYSSLYDIVVPKTHFLRQLTELCDFSFIYDELEKNYRLDFGRKAYSPIMMFKYLLLKDIYKLSDVDVVERSFSDMAFKFFLGLAPEDSVIEPSSLTKFRKLRIKDEKLLDLLIHKSVQIAIEHNLIKSKILIVDATHTKSHYNHKKPQEVLRERFVILRDRENRRDSPPPLVFPCHFGRRLALNISLSLRVAFSGPVSLNRRHRSPLPSRGSFQSRLLLKDVNVSVRLSEGAIFPKTESPCS